MRNIIINIFFFVLIFCGVCFAAFEFTGPLDDLSSDFLVTEGAITGLLSATDGTAAWSSSSLSGFTSIAGTSITGTTVTGTTLTDGVFTVSGGVISAGTWQGDTITVSYGGTGATTLTDGGLLVGSGTSAVTALGVATNGQIPIGDGTTDPVLATITAVANETDVTNAAGAITIGIVNPLIVSKGGIGTATLTDGGVLLGSGTSSVTPMAVLSDSQFIVGDGTGDPVAESGNTARTSLGLGTGDSPTWAGATVQTLTIDSTQDYVIDGVGTNLTIQSQTSAQTSSTRLHSKDADGTDIVELLLYGIGLPSSTTDSEYLSLSYDPTISAKINIYSSAGGSGTVRPLHLFTGTNTTQLVLNIDGSNSMAGALGVTGAVTGGSFITGGYIGVSGDTDLLELASGTLTVNGNFFAGTITGDGLLTINQLADDQGIKVNGFDDKSGDNFQLSVGSTGGTTLDGTTNVSIKRGGALKLLIQSTNVLHYVDSKVRYDTVKYYYGEDNDGYHNFDGTDLQFVASAGHDFNFVGYAEIDAGGAITLLGDGGTTNYVESDATGDTKFVGGAGLPFGSCYGNHIGWSQAATQDVWYNIADSDMADGNLHNVTHDGNGKLTVANAGMYLVNYSLCFQDNVANDHIEAGIEVSGSGSANDAGRCHLENKFANEEEHMGSAAILDLSASSTLEVSIRTTDIGTPTINVQAVNITCVHIGGT